VSKKVNVNHKKMMHDLHLKGLKGPLSLIVIKSHAVLNVRRKNDVYREQMKND